MESKCHCGAPIHQIHLSDFMRALTDKVSTWVHSNTADARCHPEHPEDHHMVATPIHDRVR